jgi:hypothetical protein
MWISLRRCCRCFFDVAGNASMDVAGNASMDVAGNASMDVANDPQSLDDPEDGNEGLVQLLF